MPRSVQIRTNRLMQPELTHVVDVATGDEIKDVESLAIVTSAVSGLPNAVQIIRIQSSPLLGVKRTRELAHLADIAILDDQALTAEAMHV